MKRCALQVSTESCPKQRKHQCKRPEVGTGGGCVPDCWKKVGSCCETFKNLRDKGTMVSNLIKLTRVNAFLPNVLYPNATFVSLGDRA